MKVVSGRELAKALESKGRVLLVFAEATTSTAGSTATCACPYPRIRIIP